MKQEYNICFRIPSDPAIHNHKNTTVFSIKEKLLELKELSTIIHFIWTKTDVGMTIMSGDQITK